MQRRLAAFILSALVATALWGGGDLLCARAEMETPGDCDGDGTVSAADAAALLRSLSGKKPLDAHTAAAADLTRNGETNDVDVRAALFFATGQIGDPVKFVERVSTGLCGEALFDRFYYAGVYDDGAGNYRSPNVSVSLERRTYLDSVYFFADVYVQDVRCLATAFADGRYRGGNDRVENMARENDAIIAVNGDFYSQRNLGPLIRNGETYNARVSQNLDICVLTLSGELCAFPYRTLTAETLEALGAYQSWVFGPSLLDENGRAKTVFRSAVTAANPRTVIGYYAPGHYCLLAVDGRQGKYSRGLNMEELSALCESLGLVAAYNLDGGQSTVMATRYGTVNRPAGSGRALSDIVYVREPDE